MEAHESVQLDVTWTPSKSESWHHAVQVKNSHHLRLDISISCTSVNPQKVTSCWLLIIWRIDLIFLSKCMVIFLCKLSLWPEWSKTVLFSYTVLAVSSTEFITSGCMTRSYSISAIFFLHIGFSCDLKYFVACTCVCVKEWNNKVSLGLHSS